MAQLNLTTARVLIVGQGSRRVHAAHHAGGGPALHRRAKRRVWHGQDRRSDAAGVTRFAVRIDFRLHRGQTAHRVVLEGIKQREAAGTCRCMILANLPRARETRSGPGGYDGGKRCAGARASEPQIGLVRHQQRHKSYPEYGPENHEHAILLIDASSMARGLFTRLKSFAKFETNSRSILSSPVRR